MIQESITRRGALGLAGLAVAATAACSSGQGGSGQRRTPREGDVVTSVEKVDPSSPTYYEPPVPGPDEALAAAVAAAEAIEDAGIVLLANDGTLPLAAGTRVSLLGRGAVDPVFGGRGSAFIAPDNCATLPDSLADGPLDLNRATVDFLAAEVADYPTRKTKVEDPVLGFGIINEVPWSAYPAGVRDSLAGTVGVVVVSRTACEGGDLSRDLLASLEPAELSDFPADSEVHGYEPGQHQLELTREERELIACARDACDGVVVLLNSGTSMEAGPLATAGGDCEANAILQIGLPGQAGMRSVAKVLAGEVNPSGRTCDTWAADFMAMPSVANFGDFTYTDVRGYYQAVGSGAKFVEYREGIYVGYRYYETAAAMGAIDYDDAVVFPFGHGLSYTTFDQRLVDVVVEGDEVRATVLVTNSGNVAGREVVQCYVGAPWHEGQVEKSAVVLAAFAKTAELAPGDSCEVELAWPLRSMASFDASLPGWACDPGDYEVSIRRDSHHAIESATVHLDDLVWSEDDATGAPIEPRFADLDEYLADYSDLMTRADIARTPLPAEDCTAESRGLAFAEYDAAAAADDSVDMPRMGEASGVTFADLRGRAMDDPLWEVLLDQLDRAEMIEVTQASCFGSIAVESVAKPASRSCDGPSGISHREEGTHCCYPCEYLVAQTWDVEVARAEGEALGAECLANGYCGWYAPGMNCHRTPFGGRNFEYYSEDPLLAGMLGRAAVEGAATCGVFAHIKHFCLNDQETNRCAHLCTWAPEQAVREVYARPFEIVVKGARCSMAYADPETGKVVSNDDFHAATAVMSSYNYVGATWAGGRESLVTGLLRDEWGFVGYVVSDWSFYDYMDQDEAIAAGTDVNFARVSDCGTLNDTRSASAVASMRRSMHHYLYTLAHSNLADGMGPAVRVCYGPAN